MRKWSLEGVWVRQCGFGHDALIGRFVPLSLNLSRAGIPKMTDFAPGSTTGCPRALPRQKLSASSHHCSNCGAASIWMSQPRLGKIGRLSYLPLPGAQASPGQCVASEAELCLTWTISSFPLEQNNHLNISHSLHFPAPSLSTSPSHPRGSPAYAVGFIRKPPVCFQSPHLVSRVASRPPAALTRPPVQPVAHLQDAWTRVGDRRARLPCRRGA